MISQPLKAGQPGYFCSCWTIDKMRIGEGQLGHCSPLPSIGTRVSWPAPTRRCSSPNVFLAQRLRCVSDSSQS